VWACIVQAYMYYRIFSASAHGPSVPGKPLSLITLGKVTGYYADFAVCNRLHLLAVWNDHPDYNAPPARNSSIDAPKGPPVGIELPVQKPSQPKQAPVAGFEELVVPYVA
jgi:hypothetical protein